MGLMSYSEYKPALDRDGFVVVRQFLDDDDFRELNAQLDRYIREVVPTLPDSDAFYQDRDRPETLKQMQHFPPDSFFDGGEDRTRAATQLCSKSSQSDERANQVWEGEAMRSTPLFMASRACAAAVALCCAAAALGEAPAAGEKEVGNVVFKKDRIRRVIYNDDGDQQFKQIETRYGVTDEQSFIYARTTPTFDTQVDTYVWCVGNGAWPPWGGKEWTAHDFLGSSGRAADLIVEACHGKGIEVWASLRMNDLHDAGKKRLEDTWEPIKAQHPEYLIGKPEDRELPKERIERVLWTALNFERPEVRKYRLDFIKRNAAAHDFDGYELDFSRFIWTFPLGGASLSLPDSSFCFLGCNTSGCNTGSF